MFAKMYSKMKNLVEAVSDEDLASNENTSQNELARLSRHSDPNVFIKVAGNPNTHPNDLQHLHNMAHHNFIDSQTGKKDPGNNWNLRQDIHYALTKNPSTPLPVLRDYLYGGFHDEVMRNPVIPLLQLEDPYLNQLIGSHSTTDATELASYTDNPILLHIFANSPDVNMKRAILHNKNTPDHLLHKLFNDPDKKISASVVYHKKTPPEVINKIYQDDPNNFSIVGYIARRKDLTPEMMQTLSEHPSFHVQKILAQNNNIHPNILDKMTTTDLGSNNELVLNKLIASNKNTSPETLHKLADYGDNVNSDQILGHIIDHPNVHSDTLNKLTNNRNSDINFMAKMKLGLV